MEGCESIAPGVCDQAVTVLFLRGMTLSAKMLTGHVTLFISSNGIMSARHYEELHGHHKIATVLSLQRGVVLEQKTIASLSAPASARLAQLRATVQPRDFGLHITMLKIKVTALQAPLMLHI